MAFPPNLPSLPGVPNVKEFLPGASNVLPDPPVDLMSDSTDPSHTNAELWKNDMFLNWSSLTADDYRQLFGYELVITDKFNSQRVIVASIALPISPQSLSISVPAAVSTTVTMKGIVEESNGAPLRQINIQGTSGIRPGIGQTPPTTGSFASGVASYLFKNTIQSVNNLATQARGVVASATGKTDITGNLNISSPPDLLSTGYGFIHHLQRFLDFYMSAKKQSKYKNYRLHINMFKDQMYFDVTLNGYNISKQAGTLEYFYGINLTAWRRTAGPAYSPAFRQKPLSPGAADRSANIIGRALGTLRQARRTVLASNQVLTGIRTDIQQSFYEPLREAILLGSDTVNLAASVIDFPNALKNDFKNAYVTSINSANPAFQNLRDSRNNASQLLTGGQAAAVVTASAAALGSVAAIGASTVQGQNALSPDGSPSPVGDDANQFSANAGTNLDPNSITGSPITDDNIKVTDFPLSANLEDAIQAEIDRVRSLDANYFRAQREKMLSVVNSISVAFGLGDSTYNRVKGWTSPKATFHKPSASDVALLSSLNDILSGMDQMIVALDEQQPDLNTDYYSFYQDYATSRGIAFNTAASKYYVPFPFGASLDALALQYLGDSSRWIEIAALNGLKQPYIDEEGYTIQLNGSGSGASVTIPDPGRLYVGQVVTLGSKTVVGFKRKITAIQKISEISTVVQFDGDANLSILNSNDNPYLKAYLPDTVNSEMLIAIPSDSPVNVQGKIKLHPGTQDLNGLAQISKTDFLLMSDGDIAITASGDVKLATGLTNITQAAILKLRTKRSDLIQDPSYGNSIQVGTSTAEINSKQALKDLSAQFTSDPRFTGLLAGTVIKQGTAAVMQLLVGISGSQINLPLTADVPL